MSPGFQADALLGDPRAQVLRIALVVQQGRLLSKAMPAFAEANKA